MLLICWPNSQRSRRKQPKKHSSASLSAKQVSQKVNTIKNHSRCAAVSQVQAFFGGRGGLWRKGRKMMEEREKRRMRNTRVSISGTVWTKAITETWDGSGFLTAFPPFLFFCKPVCVCVTLSYVKRYFRLAVIYIQSLVTLFIRRRVLHVLLVLYIFTTICLYCENMNCWL